MPLNDFNLYRRKSGDGRSLLSDDTAIRDGFAHFKLILLTAVRDGTEIHHAIFTTANLTKAVWEQPSDRFEIGIWVRPDAGAGDVHEFGKLLGPCYAEPDQEEYETIDTRLDEVEQSQGYRDKSIGDVLRGRLQIDEDILRFDWPDGYPPLTEVSCTATTRNIVTTDFEEYHIDLHRNRSEYIADIGEIPLPPDTVVNRVRFEITTTLKPPIRDVEPGELESALDVDRNIDWAGVLIGSHLQQSSLKSLSTDNDQSVVLYQEWETPRSYAVYSSIVESPHLSSPLLKEICSETQILPGTNAQVPVVHITVSENIDPPFDTLVFETANGTGVSPLGYAKDGHNLRFYFKPASGGQRLSVGFKSPYTNWNPERQEVELPIVDDELPTWIQKVNQQTWPHQPVLKTNVSEQEIMTSSGIDPTRFITETTPVQIDEPAGIRSLPNSVTRTYGFNRRGSAYHRPQSNPLSEWIPSQPPYATVEYWGEYRLQEGANTIVLPTQQQHYNVRKQLAQQLLPDKTVLTADNRIPWDELHSLVPIGWLVVPHEQLAFDTVPEQLHDDVSLDVYRNDQLLPTETAYVTHHQPGYAVPITKQDCLDGLC